jgi:hypothetical protein
VFFSFQNREIIQLLAQRGALLKTAEFKKADDIEEKINKLQNEHFDSLTIPTKAFVTFEHLETSEMAQEGMKVKFFEDLKETKMKKAEYAG